MSTVNGLRLALRQQTIPPATEKILSEWNDAAGIPRHLRATSVSQRHMASFSFNYANGLVLTWA